MPMGRIIGILFRPARTFDLIAGDLENTATLYKDVIAPLAAVPAVCGAVGLMVFGPSIAGIHLRSGVGASLASALASYVLTLAAVYVLALIVTGLAPLFDGAADRLQALKLVAYAGVPLWLAGLFSLYPTLGFVMGMLGALYSLWLLYLGLPRLMSAPAARTLTYFAAVLVVTILIGVGLRLATLLIP